MPFAQHPAQHLVQPASLPQHPISASALHACDDHPCPRRLHPARSLCSHLLLLTLLCIFLVPVLFVQPVRAEMKHFGEFSLDLPAGWDGTERQGFASKDQNEYMLTVGLKDESGEQYRAYISLYLLPNKTGQEGQEWAKALAEKQAESTPPAQDGVFWVFSGDPRDKILKGRAKTHVAANAENVLIIIAKDPEGVHAEGILKTLTANSDRAKALLGDAYTGHARQTEALPAAQ